MSSGNPKRTQVERSDQARARILEAAVQQFSENGLSGARTEQIAAQAGVNKALLYYYFESKEALYSAALELTALNLRDRSVATTEKAASPGECLMRVALDHFDRILMQGEFQRLLQHEMQRQHNGENGALPLLVKRVFAPMLEMQRQTLEKGIASGELVEVDWIQMHLSALGANLMYFMSAYVWSEVLNFDPFEREQLARRRKSLVEYLGATIFIDRQRGSEIAARVLAELPMPETVGLAGWMEQRQRKTKRGRKTATRMEESQ